MNSLKFFAKNIYTWFSLWLVLLIYYAIAVNYGHNDKNADYVAYVAQLVADLSIGILSFLAYRKAPDKTSKRFLQLIFISTTIGLGANEVYNLLFNIIKLNISSDLNALWVLLYTFFLVGQLWAWAYLLYVNRSPKSVNSKTWLTKLPFLQYAAMLVLTIFILSVFISSVFKSSEPQSVGVTIAQLINTLLETSLFIVLSICLSKSKTKFLSYIATGFLLLVAFNMAQRFSYMTGHDYKTFDIAWLISFLFGIYGFSKFLGSSDKKFEFFDQNSLYVLTSATFTLFSSLIFVVFILLEFFITSLEINRLGNVKVLLENVPSILIFSFTLSVLFSKVMAAKLSHPLDRVFKRIDLVQDQKINPIEIANEKFAISEIDKLDKFILKTVTQLHLANKVKSEFLMHMSHDLRTPASGVHSMAKLIHNKIADTKLQRLQKLVVDSSRQLLDLLDEVLDYSKSDSDSTAPKLSEIDIREMVHEIILFMGAKAEEKGLHLSANAPENPILYCGDRILLHRILVNIVSNAIKFTQTGSVTISVYEQQESSTKNSIVIAVKDTGIGIDKQYQDIIFDPFFRVASEEVSQYVGVGLGLSNVRLMLNKLGGRISVDSCLGDGSTFTIFLPN